MFRRVCKNLPIKSASSKLVGCDANGFMHQNIGAIFLPNFWWKKVCQNASSSKIDTPLNLSLPTCRSKILPLRRQYICRNTLRCLLYLNTAPESEKYYIAQKQKYMEIYRNIILFLKECFAKM